MVYDIYQFYYVYLLVVLLVCIRKGYLPLSQALLGELCYLTED